MSKLKFKDCSYDSDQLLEETGIGHMVVDDTLYTTYRDFNNNVFKGPLCDLTELEEFPNIDNINSFGKMLSSGFMTNLEVEFGDVMDDDWHCEKLPCREILFDDSSEVPCCPCYLQIINLTENKLEVVKEYLTAYDWRFDNVGFFKYKGSDYIYLLCDEEN